MNIGVQSWISDNMLKSKTAKGQYGFAGKRADLLSQVAFCLER